MKEVTQGKGRLAEQESPPSLGYDWFSLVQEQQKSRNSNGALKTKMREEVGFACWDCWLLCFVP